MSGALCARDVRQVVRLLVPSMSDRGRQFWNHPDLAVLYPRYLVTTHGVIRASVPLMREAAAELERHWGHDPATEQVLAYLHQHIPEETGHDDWIIEDLARIGIPEHAIVDHPPSSTVMQLVGSQYYLIKHVHPGALLGYISALEGYPPSIELSKLASARTGYPIEAFRTLRKHAHLDPHHRDDLDAVLDATPFSEPLAAAIRANALEAIAGLIRIIDEILRQDPRTVLACEDQPPAAAAS